MDVLIKKVKVIGHNSPHNGKVKDILIRDGTIKKIADNIFSDDFRVISYDNLHISAGWLDMNVTFGEPGMEERETISTGLRSASKGGFTGVAMMPDVLPCIDSDVGINYVKKAAQDNIVDIYPIGALTKGCKGKEISESFSMKQAGAVAFSDNKRTIPDDNLMKLVSLYIKNFDGLLISFAHTESISAQGQMNEGIISTKLGLRGIPVLSEDLRLYRDIAIAKYTGCRLHIQCISTAKSVEMIRQAKQNGYKVTAHTTPAHLCFTEEELLGFDTQYKLLPPLRSKQDVEALKKAVKQRIIGLSSDHTPINIEAKQCEFEYAEFGTIALESAFGAALSALQDIDLVVDLFTNEPRKILGLPLANIQEGEKAEFTVFDPNKKWVFKKEDIYSKSKNSIFLNEKLLGKPIGIYNNNKLSL